MCLNIFSFFSFCWDQERIRKMREILSGLGNYGKMQNEKKRRKA